MPAQCGEGLEVQEAHVEEMFWGTSSKDGKDRRGEKGNKMPALAIPEPSDFMARSSLHNL